MCKSVYYFLSYSSFKSRPSFSMIPYFYIISHNFKVFISEARTAIWELRPTSFSDGGGSEEVSFNTV